jgi:uncharacterized RDD family membrane protein YckC
MSADNLINLHDYIETEKKDPQDVLEPRKIFFKRMGAFFIDLITISFLHSTLFAAYRVFVDSHLYFLTSSSKDNLVESVQMIEIPILFLVFLTYFTLTLYIYQGKTLGKMIMKISTIHQDFLQEYGELNYMLSFQQCYRRALAYAFCYLSVGTLFAVSYFTKGQRGLPDFMAQSQTILDKDLENFIQMKTAQDEVQINVENLDAYKRPEAA